MRSYSRDPNNRVALVRDKLCINGELYIPPNSSETNVQSWDMQRARDSYLGNRRRARGARLAQQPTVESRNRFDPLSFVDISDAGRINSY